ncbi:hypothetical protein EDD15DRAFT_2197896 [Pisolithus albus]|nr:hypothetical protein EDD15DRAFT_2197896 [Pisolithus albus]
MRYSAWEECSLVAAKWRNFPSGTGVAGFWGDQLQFSTGTDGKPPPKRHENHTIDRCAPCRDGYSHAVVLMDGNVSNVPKGGMQASLRTRRSQVREGAKEVATGSSHAPILSPYSPGDSRCLQYYPVDVNMPDSWRQIQMTLETNHVKCARIRDPPPKYFHRVVEDKALGHVANDYEEPIAGNSAVYQKGTRRAQLNEIDRRRTARCPN